MQTTITEIADRIRPTDHIAHNGQKLLIVDITDASTPSRPGRLAVLAIDPHGRTVGRDGARLLLIDPGYTLEFRVHPGPRSPHAATTRTQMRRQHGCWYEVYDNTTGMWVQITPGPQVGMFSGLAEADEQALNLLCRATTTPAVDPEVDRIVTALRKSVYKSTAEHVLGTGRKVVDEAIELGLVRVVTVKGTTYNRQGERMLAAV